MYTIRYSIAVCATVLLVVGLSGQFVHAGGRLDGIKELFARQKNANTKSCYAVLADYLYKATKSEELADNMEATRLLLSERPDIREDVYQLAQAFGSLKANPNDPESFCSKDNLANLRRVAEGIRDGGNLGPKKIKGAILRLNTIVVNVIADAREVCHPYLSRLWPGPWQPNFSDEAMKLRIESLRIVSDSFTYEGYKHSLDPSAEYQSYTMSLTIRKGEEDASESIDPDEPDTLLTKNRNVIALQLDKYIYKPCTEFVSFDETKEVLVPFNDLLKSWYVVRSSLLEEYYKNKRARRRFVTWDHTAAAVEYLAISYQACQRFLTTPRETFVKRISEYRAISRGNTMESSFD